MSSKVCARPECGKVVYPLEELKCLDKVWHKQCFKCTACGMVLNMKNYKGYEKMPYCEPHYPKTKASVVSDTPEMRRLAEATKNQSLVRYHEDYEKSMKGHKIDVTDDPETQRHLKNTSIVSQATYHGDAATKQAMEKVRPPMEELSAKAAAPKPLPAHQTPSVPSTAPPNVFGAIPTAMMAAQQTKSPPPSQQQQQQAKTNKAQQQPDSLIYSSEQGGRVAPTGKQVGSIADYDPLSGQWGSVVSGRPANPAPSYNHHPAGKGPTAPTTPTGFPGAGQPKRTGGASYRAMYDYSAADTDEVSFKEGDVIVNCQAVDEGWMTGTVQRTGKWGMLPANYVERAH